MPKILPFYQKKYFDFSELFEQETNNLSHLENAVILGRAVHAFNEKLRRPVLPQFQNAHDLKSWAKLAVNQRQAK